MIPRRKTLYWRLSSTLLLVLLLVSAVQFLVFQALFTHMNDELLQQMNWHIARDLAVRIAPLLEPEIRYFDLRAAIDDFLAVNEAVNVFVLDGQGAILADFSKLQSTPSRTHISLEPILDFLADVEREQVPHYGSNPNGDREVIFSAAAIPGAERRFLYVTIGGESLWLASRLLTESTAIRGAIAFVVLSSLVAALIGLTMFYLITRRFFALTELVQKFARGDYSQRFAVDGSDEIAEHGRAVNTLADAIVANLAELAHRDRVRKELIADISHDLRRPVTLISSYAEVLDTPETTTVEQARIYCRGISNNVRALRRLLEELFELALLESNERSPVVAPFIVEELFDELLPSYEPAAEARSIALRKEVSEEAHVAHADAGMIGRVVSNLLENALRYTPEGGSITVSATTHGDMIRISVADTGRGIAEDELPFIFDRTFQGRKVEDQTRGVSGLGLAIVKRIVESHGSHIGVESSVGSGTVFFFDLRRSA